MSAEQTLPQSAPGSAALTGAREDELFDRAFAAVLFDMDGTLVDSTAAVLRSWLAWADEYDVPPEQLSGHHGVPAAQLVELLLPEEKVAEAVERIDAMEIADFEGVVALPGAADALAALAGRGHSAIVTSCKAPLYAARVAAAQLTPPEVAVTASDVRRGKPDPEPFLLGASRLGVDPADCLVVEDAPSGLKAAKAAGCTTLAVVSTSTPEELDALGLADVVVPDLSHVRFVVEEGGGIRVLGVSAT